MLRLDVKDGFPPEGSDDLWHLRERHAVFHHKAFERAAHHHSAEDKDRAGVVKLKKAWEYFRHWWPGPPSRADGRYVFYRRDVITESAQSIARNMAKAVVGLFFMRLPPKPEEGKWTKTAPATTWCSEIMTASTLFQDLVDDAWRGMHINVTSFNVAPGAKLSFTEMTGVRLAGIRFLSEDRLCKLKILILDLCMIGTRYITCFFLRTSRSHHEACRPNAAWDVLNPQTSAIMVAAQFYGSVGSGKGQHLRLIWGGMGYDSYGDFMMADEEGGRLCRVSIYLAASLTNRRSGGLFALMTFFILCLVPVRHVRFLYNLK